MLSREDADNLVLEHQGWAESIARSVARAWNMDWRLDGLDGAAMEALIFCARRFDPSRGIPFRGYARKRIHEASSEAARKCKGWRRGSANKADDQAREISAELLHIFPELREGELPSFDEGAGEGEMRGAIRQLLVGANIVSARFSIDTAGPDELLDIKRLLEHLGSMEIVHQYLMWRVYWEGDSMRTVASDWETDELNVIREHKVILSYLMKCLSLGKPPPAPRIRPGLKPISLKLKKSNEGGAFSSLLQRIRDS